MYFKKEYYLNGGQKHLVSSQIHMKNILFIYKDVCEAVMRDRDATMHGRFETNET
jgi:hypothetical protein